MRGSFFDVVPKFYILPRDRQELKKYAAAHPEQLYIQKASMSSCLAICTCSHASHKYTLGHSFMALELVTLHTCMSCAKDYK